MDIIGCGPCPNGIKADATDLSMFRDKEFGSVFTSCTLEHIDDINRAWHEIRRVSDRQWVVHPQVGSLFANLCVHHKHVILSAPPDSQDLMSYSLRRQ